MLTKGDKEYIRHMIAQTIFSCYIGKKDVEELINHPETITDIDWDHIALPIVEINQAKKIFNNLKIDL